MLKSIGATAAVYPCPVLIVGTYDADGTANAMNVAWGGQCGPKYVCLALGEHKTTDLIAEKRCFTVAIADRANLVAADYVGIVSGNKESEKVAKAGWTAVPGEQVDAPVFQELPVTMECKVVSISEELGETCVVGEVVNTQVSEAHLTEAGKVDVSGMLADEPTAGLDAENARAVHALLREIDFLLTRGFSDAAGKLRVSPVEAKSTKTYSTVSLDDFARRFPKCVGDEFVLHTKQLRIEGKRLYLSLYMAHLL